MISKLSGVQLINSNNYTRTSREGYLDYNFTVKKWLDYDPSKDINIYTHLSPGLYGIIINGVDYIFLLRENLLMFGELCIKNESDIFVIQNIIKYNITPYKFNGGRKLSANENIILNNTVNDHIDILIIQGESNFNNVTDKSINNLSNAQHHSSMQFTISKDDIIESTVIDFKIKLKSLISESGDILSRDILYLDAENNVAIIEQNIGELILTGNERIERYNGFNSDILYATIPIQNCKSKDSIWCNIAETNVDPEYKDSIIYDDKINKLVLMMNRETNMTVPALIEKIKSRYDLGSPVEILYQLKNPIYTKIILDNYNINTLFNDCYLSYNRFNISGLFYKHYRQ